MRSIGLILITCVKILTIQASYSASELMNLMTAIIASKYQASCTTFVDPLGEMDDELRKVVKTRSTSVNVTEQSDVWLVFPSPADVNPAEYLSDVDLPYKSQYLVIRGRGNEKIWDIQEVWRVAQGYPLRSAKYAVGNFNEDLSFFPTPREKGDLEGLLLRASTKDDPPISGLSRNLRISGFFGEVFYELIDRLNATLEVVPSVDNMTGAAEGGVWNGLIGMLQRNETDFAVGPMSLRFGLLSILNYVRPLLRTNGVITEWDMFFKPFGWKIWGLMAAWLLVGTLALNYFYRVGVSVGNERAIFNLEFTKINAFFLFLQSYCQQGNNMVPKSWSCRGLFITGYLMSTVLLTSYSAALISSLTVKIPARPFDSFEEFFNDGSYTLTAIAKSTDYTYFSEAQEPLLQSIYRKLIQPIAEEELPHGKEEGMEHVCTKSKRALFITSAVTVITAREFRTKRDCPVLYFRKPLGTVYLTVGIRKDIPYDRLINIELQRMVERGILNRLQKKEWPLHTVTDEEEVAVPEVEIQQIAQIHGVLMVGIFISLAVLATEIFLFERNVKYLQDYHYGLYLNCENFSSIIILFFILTIIITTIFY